MSTAPDAIGVMPGSTFGLEEKKELKAKIPLEYHRKLLSLRVLRNKGMSEAVEQALDDFFSSQDLEAGVSPKPPKSSRRSKKRVEESRAYILEAKPQQKVVKEVKLMISIKNHLRLHNLKVLKGVSMTESIRRALELYFQELPSAKKAEVPERE